MSKINFDSWKVPELSEEKMTAIFGEAKGRFIKRRLHRRIAMGCVAGIFLCVVSSFIFYLRVKSPAGQMAQLNEMLKEDVKNNRGKKFFASSHGHESFIREVTHDM